MAATYLGRSLLSGVDANVTPTSGTVTVNASADYCLVKIQAGDDVGQPDITSVTLGGVAMSAVGAQSDGFIAGLPTTMQMFELVDPPTGSQTLTVNYNLPPFTAHATAEYYSGVDQTTPSRGLQTTTGTSTAVNAGVTTTTESGNIVSGHLIADLAGVANLSTADTEIAEVVGTAFADVVLAMAYQNVTGSGAQVNWTLTSSAGYRAQAVEIVAAATGAQELTPSLYSNGQTFYSPTVTRGAVNLSPSLYNNNQTFYSATVTTNYSLTASLFTNNNTFYSPTIAVGAVELTPSLFTNSNTLYAHSISVGAVTLTPSLFINSNTFLAATISQGGAPQELTPSVYNNINTFYAHGVSVGSVDLTPSLFSNSNVFYSAMVSAGSVNISPDLFSNSNTFYAPIISIAGGVQYIAPELFVNNNTFYSASIDDGLVVATRGGGVDHQRKRKKSTLADRPIEHLNKIIDESFSDIKAAKEAFKELTGKKASKNVKKQANKLVAEYSEAYRPKVNEIDWVAFANDLEAANLLFKLYQKEIADKRLFDIIENDNIEFLLMH